MKKYNKQKKGNENEPLESQTTNEETDGGSAGDNKIITIILGVIAVLLTVQTIQLFLGGGEPPPPRPQITGQQTQQTPAQQQDDFSFDQQPTGPVTDVTYSTMAHDFGQVSPGQTYRHTFELRNTGDVDLQYTNVYGDPGLNVVSWPNQPIPPGGTGEIEVELNPEGESGSINKLIHIDGNTTPGHVHLNVSASAN